MRLAFVILVVAGCGRFHFDRHDSASDAPPVSDAPTMLDVDAPVACPADTTELAPGSTVCIELLERAPQTWTPADSTCRAIGRRLCGDTEWLLACRSASGLVDMYNDAGGTAPNWEWVADIAAGVASKRGLGSCDDLSSVDADTIAYDFRCCANKQ